MMRPNRWQIRQRASELVVRNDDDLEAAVSALCRHVSAGLSVLSAIDIVQRSHPTSLFGDVLAQTRRGFALADACERCDSSDPDRSLTIHVLALVARHGGEPAPQLEALAATLSDRRRARAERRAHASTALASTRFLTLLPIVCSVWICLDDPAVRNVLLTSPIGWMCLVGGLSLNLIGRRWVRRMVSAT